VACGEAVSGFHSRSLTPDAVARTGLTPHAQVSLHDGSVIRPFDGSLHIVDIAAGPTHFVAAVGHLVLVGGSNEYGQLGTPQLPADGAGSGDFFSSATAEPVYVRSLSMPRMVKPTSLSALAPGPRVLSVAAGRKHTLVVVMRTREDAFFDVPDEAQSFQPFTEVLGCGYARSGALVKDATAVQSALESIPFFRFEGIEKAWAVDDCSFVFGRRGLFMFGTLGRSVHSSPLLVLPVPSPDVHGGTVVANRVVSVAGTSDAIFVLTDACRVLRMRHAQTQFEDVSALVVPTVHPQDGRPKMLTAGKQHVVITTDRGVVLGWGGNAFGQLGGGASEVSSAIKVQPPLAMIESETVEEAPSRPASVADRGVGDVSVAASTAETKVTAISVTPKNAMKAAPKAVPKVMESPGALNKPRVVEVVAAVATGYSTVIMYADGSMQSLGRRCM